jgi:prolyl oligopeptidase
MLTRVPHLFRAAVGNVGLYDMVRYHRFPPAELWVDEYGSAEDAGQLGYLLGYSPYHQVIDGVRYPAALLTTADRDTRVHWMHTAKFAARLQQATTSKEPVLFYLNRKEGHGAGKGKSDIIRDCVRRYAFLLHELGMGDAASPRRPRKAH